MFNRVAVEMIHFAPSPLSHMSKREGVLITPGAAVAVAAVALAPLLPRSLAELFYFHLIAQGRQELM